MHRHYAKALLDGIEATQYVHPWQHGTGHTKATGLYLSLSEPPPAPASAPTCIVPSRESVMVMANLPMTPHHGALRSRAPTRDAPTYHSRLYNNALYYMDDQPRTCTWRHE